MTGREKYSCAVRLYVEDLLYPKRRNGPETVEYGKPATGPEAALYAYICLAELNVNNPDIQSERFAPNAAVEQTQVFRESTIPRRLMPQTAVNDDFQDFLMHPTKVAHLNWLPATTYALLTNDLFHFTRLAMDAKLDAKFQALWFVRAKLRIRVVVQGQAQAFGQLVYAFSPRSSAPMLGTNTGYIAGNQIHNFRIIPHICVDPSKSGTYELDLPICTPTGFYENTTTNSHGSYAMEQFIINPLRSGTAVAPNINICVYVSLVDVEMQGLTTLLSGSYESEKDPLKVSDVMDVVAKASAMAAPMTGEFAPATTLFSSVTGSLANVLRFFGFAKPPLHDISSLVTNRTCDNYSQSDGTSTAIVLGCSQKQPLSISPDFAFGDMNDMSIDFIAAQEAMIKQDFTILPAVAAETALFSIPVLPGMSSASNGPSPLCGLSLVSTYWCGDITFQFEVLASVFHRATLLVAWDPFATSTTAPAFLDALNLLQNTTIQVAGSVTVNVLIPYNQIMPALKTSTGFYASSPGVRGTSNGMIYVYLVNPVVSNGSTDGIAVNVFMYSKNIRFLGPFNGGVNNSIVTEVLGSKYRSESYGIPSDVSFGKSTDLTNIAFRCTGDVVRSVKDLTSRSSKAAAALSHTGTGAGAWGFSYNIGNIPFSPIDATVMPQVYSWTYLGWFASAYHAYRGSIGYSWYSNTTKDNTATDFRADRVFVMRDTIVSNTVGPIAGNAYVGATDGTQATRYALTQTNLEISSRCDFIAPMIINLDFFPCRTLYTAYHDCIIVNAMNNELNADTSSQSWSLLVRSGDDAVFSWFLGFPRTVTQL